MTDLGERIAKLEVTVEEVRDRQENMSKKVDLMYDILMQVKGDRYHRLESF